MNENEYKIIKGNKNLIICFGGSALKFGGIIPFEFLKYLSSTYNNNCDMVFFIDKHQCWYHTGINIFYLRYYHLKALLYLSMLGKKMPQHY